MAEIVLSVAVLLPLLLGVAFLTVLERKVMGAMQRRVSVNVVGPLGLLQPFADALKLLSKENLVPAHSLSSVFLASPLLVLFFSLAGWLVLPLYGGGPLLDVKLGAAYSLAVSSLAVYGVLLAGWGANSKYAFLGSIRSTAQLISYELLFSTCVLMVVVAASSFSLSEVVDGQQPVAYCLPLLPLVVIYAIACLAETNRAPFDNVEAESELVAGFFAEHSSVPFVMFFLGEYNALLLVSALSALLFFGDLAPTVDVWVASQLLPWLPWVPSLGLKTALVAMLFVWVRATLPRFRFDTLLVFCWLKLLPVVVALLLLEVSLLVVAG